MPDDVVPDNDLHNFLFLLRASKVEALLLPTVLQYNIYDRELSTTYLGASQDRCH